MTEPSKEIRYARFYHRHPCTYARSDAVSAYVKVVRSIWTDPEWLDLSSTEKLIYLQLISQPNISKCGVLPFVPRRWAHMHPDLGPDDLNAAIDSLERLGYVFVDRDTEELLVRTYMRYDEAWRQTNGVRGIQIEAEQIMSKPLLQQVLQEFEKASGNPLHKGNDNPCDNPCDNSNATPLTPIPYPNTPSPEPQSPDQVSSRDLVLVPDSGSGGVQKAEVVPDWEIRFAQFWALYPRKDNKKGSRTIFKNLTKRDQIAALEALPNHVEFWKADNRTMKLIPLPTTWLHGERWEDELKATEKKLSLAEQAARFALEKNRERQHAARTSNGSGGDSVGEIDRF
jgi:hypothetical protein